MVPATNTGPTLTHAREPVVASCALTESSCTREQGQVRVTFLRHQPASRASGHHPSQTPAGGLKVPGLTGELPETAVASNPLRHRPS